MIKTILTGCHCIDNHLNGGIYPESLTLIYGEPETGKSTLAMQCAVNCALQGYKTLYVDCDSTFAPKRLAEVAAGRFDEIAELINLIRPIDFTEQTAVIDRLSEYTAKNFGLTVIDTFTSLYRVKVAETSGKAFESNRELNRQMAILAQTAKTQKMPIILTSQVRSVFDNPQVSVEPVATRVLKFWADTIIAMKPTENPQAIRAVLEKMPGSAHETHCDLIIDEIGVHDSSFHY